MQTLYGSIVRSLRNILSHEPPPLQAPQYDLDVPRLTLWDAQFLWMLRTYRRLGGVVRLTEMERPIAGRLPLKPGDGVFSWLTSGKLFAFKWRSEHWLPLFQIDVVEFWPLPAVESLLNGFDGICDDWQIALWFAMPTPVLQGSSPAECILANPAAVLGAAKIHLSCQKGDQPN